MTSGVTLRLGGPADRAFVLDLGRRTAGDSVSALRPVPLSLVRASYENLVAFALERSHVLLIAELAFAGPAGFILMLEDMPDEVTALAQGFVAYMAVEPSARRQGIAARLLEAAEETARRRNLPALALMVTENNVAARELYAQAGYATERRLLCKAL